MAVSINRQLASVIDGDGDIKGSLIDSALVVSLVSLTKTYDSIGALPLVNVNQGEQAIVTDASPEGNALYVRINDGWYRQAIINVVPSFSGLDVLYNLDSAGTNIQIITVDPEGFSPTLSFQTIPSNITDSAFDIIIDDNTNIISLTPQAGVYYPTTFRLKVFSTDGANVISDSAVINYDGRKVLYFGDSASSSITVDEGDTVTIGLSTQGFSDGFSIPFSVTGTTDSADITGGAYTDVGDFTVNNNFASISITFDSDQTTEGSESMVWSLTSPEAWNSIPSTYTINVNDTSVEPTYELSAPANVNEGSVLTITLTTTNVKNGVTVPYTITGIETADINGASLTGNLGVNNNTAAVDFSITADYLTEGAQTLALTLDGGLDSINVTINDTSVLGGTTMTSDVSSVNEGSSVSFYGTSTGVPNGYRLYWKLASGSVSNPDVSNYTFSSNAFQEEGYLTFNNNQTNSISFTLASDQTTEGTEYLKLQATRLTTGTGTLVRNESSLRSVTINDTSVNPAIPAGSSITGTDQPSSITSYGAQFANPSYSSNGDHLPFISSAMQLGDWCYIYTSFYSAGRWVQAYDQYAPSSFTFVSPSANIYNGWSNRCYVATGASYGSTWKSYSRDTSSMSYSQLTGRFVWRYRQGSSSGTADRGVIQMVNLNLTTIGAVGTNNGGTTAIAGWETSTNHAYGCADYTDVTSWTSLAENTAGRWNYQKTDINHPGAYAQSNGTGVRGYVGSNRNSFWTYVAGQSASEVGYYWLRSPVTTLPSAYASATFNLGRRGANMGSLEMYWVPS